MKQKLKICGNISENMKKEFEKHLIVIDGENYRLNQIRDLEDLGRKEEATSEKMSMGFFCDGRVSLVAGTHTHIPTADAMILPKGTGYITDVGMCGDYYSVIGMKVETALPRFTHNIRQRLQPAEAQGTLCAVFLETDDNTGLCTNIRSVRIGAHLAETD